MQHSNICVDCFEMESILSVVPTNRQLEQVFEINFN